MALRILEKLKKVFSVKDWREVTRSALAQKEFLIEPFLSKLHECERAEKEQEMSRARTAPQQSYGQPQRGGYRTNQQPAYAAQPRPYSRQYEDEREEEKKKQVQSIHALMEAARQQNIQ